MAYSVLDIDPRDLLTKAFSRVLKPIEQARGLPNYIYLNQSAYEQECDRIFADGWTCIGFTKDVSGPKNAFPVYVAGRPLLMVRSKDGTIQVFHNVCQHRGRILIEEPMTLGSAIVCPYHSWAYDFDGALIKTPHVGGVGKHSYPSLNKDEIHLKKVRSAQWFGLVFVDLSGVAEEFDDFITPIAVRWEKFASVPLVHTGDDCTITFELDCNWKLAVENYCEAYHLPWVHPELNHHSPLEHHYNIVETGYSGQISESYVPSFPEATLTFPHAPNLPSTWGTRAEYVALFPNILLGIHRDYFFAVLILPSGPVRTCERFEIFYFDETVSEPAYVASRAANRDLWETIFNEDRSAIEAMQRGRQSTNFDGGIFSPVMDPPTHAFHSWIARAWTTGRTSLNDRPAAKETEAE